MGRVVQSVLRQAKGWTVQERIPVGTSLSALPNRPWDPPSLVYNGYHLFPGFEVLPGRAAEHSHPSNAAVMEEKSYTSTHPLDHAETVIGKLYLFFWNLRTIFVRLEGFSCLVSVFMSFRHQLYVNYSLIKGFNIKITTSSSPSCYVFVNQ